MIPDLEKKPQSNGNITYVSTNFLNPKLHNVPEISARLIAPELFLI